MGWRVPGGRGPAELWRRLVEGHDANGEGPRERFDVDVYDDPRSRIPTAVVSRATRTPAGGGST